MTALLSTWIMAVAQTGAQAPAVHARTVSSPLLVERTPAGSAAATYETVAGGGHVEISSEGFRVAGIESSDSPVRDVFAITFEGASASDLCLPEAAATGRIHRLRGSRPDQWQPDRPVLTGLRFEGVYEDLDVRWYGREGRLEHDLIARSARALEYVVVRVEGATALSLAPAGEVVIQGYASTIRLSPPHATVKDSGEAEPRAVACDYEIIGSDRFRYRVRIIDRERPITVDPSIVYSTFFGGSVFDQGVDLAVDAAGRATFTGRTSGDLPTTPGAFDVTFGGGFLGDAFVARLNVTGTSLEYSTYLGGTGGDLGRGVVVDSASRAACLVNAGSLDLPVSPGAVQPAVGGAYVALLNAQGSALQFATYFGGFQTGARSIALDLQGRPRFCGDVAANEIPVTPGAVQVSFAGVIDAYEAGISSDGQALLEATYLGGIGSDTPYAISVDPCGRSLLVGETSSSDFPTTAGVIQPSLLGQSDAFVVALQPGAQNLSFSTFIGGTVGAPEQGLDVVASPQGAVHVVGITYAGDFPVTPGAFNAGYVNTPATFVLKLSSDGSQLLYSTRLSSAKPGALTVASGIVLGPTGSVTVVGTSYVGYPTTPNALPGTLSASHPHALVTTLSPLGTSLSFSTLFGGSKLDGAVRIARDGSGNVCILGGTESVNFPTTPGAFDSTLTGPDDVFVTKVAGVELPPGIVAYGAGAPGCSGAHALTSETAISSSGSMLTFTCTSPPATGSGLILLSDQQDPAGGDPLFVGVPFYVGVWTPSLAGIDIASGGSDLASVTVPLPSLAGLVGQTYYAQAFWYWLPSVCTPSPFGLSASNGLAITILP